MTHAGVAISKRGHYLLVYLKRYYEVVSAKCWEWVRSTASDRADHQERAISMLRSGTADADAREWAERYLCGMASSEQPSFMSDRRAQS